MLSLEGLEAEKAALMDFREWLNSKLLAVEMDLYVNEIVTATVLQKMGVDYGKA